MLRGKLALVTGAGAERGIGRACAERLIADGATVVATEREGEALSALSTWAAETRSAEAIALDVSQPASIDAAIAAVLDRHGGIDVLINNAGTTVGTGDFLATTPQAWESSFAVNLLGPVRLMQSVIPGMVARGSGSIVNMGSTGSLGAEAGFGAYTAMKHGLVGATKTVAAEFGDRGVRCNIVCPGYIATDMHEGANHRIARERGESVDQIRAERYRGVAMRRAGSPEEVAEVVAFLAGPGAAYINGAALPVSGGTPVGL